MSLRFTKADIEELLLALGEELTRRGITARLRLVGGAALALNYYDRAGTRDVDASMHPAQAISQAADAVASQMGLHNEWLNDHANAFVPPPDFEDDATEVMRVGSLIVEVSGPRTLLAMKLRAARPAKDADDIAVLLRACEVTTTDEAEAVLDELYGAEHELSPVARRLVARALGPVVINTASGEQMTLDAVAR